MNSRLKTPWKKVVSVFPKENFSLELEWENAKRTRLCLESRIKEKDIFLAAPQSSLFPTSFR
ncbi:hypothetical protein GMMP1_860006 [Candidatus Magnetomoraceae bacterium gMMP-1]